MRPLASCSAATTLFLALVPVTAQAQLTQLETDRLRLVYIDATESYLTPHAARTFENSRAFQRRLLGFDPSEKVTVLLTDFTDTGNAGATAVPRDFVGVQIAPLSASFETLASNERMNTIMNHELVHVAAMDRPSGTDRAFRRLFGGKVAPISAHPESILYFYLTTPRVAAPRWYHEGIAVFLDTWMAGGIGRAQSAYDEMVFRSMAVHGSRFYDPLGLVSEGTKVDFQVEINSYLYGARFMTWLAYRYSPEAVVRWVSRERDSKAYYASQFKHVFGTSLENAWAGWVSWEREFQGKNLEAVRTYPTTPYRDISRRALGSVSRAYLDKDAGKLYAAFNYPGVVAHVGAISLQDGSVEKITDIKGPVIYAVSSLAYEPASRTIFYTADNNAHRDLMAVDVRTKRTRMLIKDARVGDLALNASDRSLWGIRHFNGICTLVRIPPPYKEWFRVFSWPYGQVVYDIDVSPDGRLFSASLGEVDGRHSLRVIPTDGLLAGDATARAEVEFPGSVPSSFTFSPDGRYLYGTSYQTGVSNIFRYEIATGAREALSNAETGFFRPIVAGEGSLIVFRYTGEGFVPATIEARPLTDVSAITFLGQQLVEQHPVIKSWVLGSPAAVPFDLSKARTGPYRPARSLRLESFYPVVEGYKDFAALGVHFAFSDPVQLNRAGLTASYSPDRDLPAGERLHLHAEYERSEWKARFRLNDADFYDLFGPTRTSRKGYSLGLGYARTLVYDPPRQLDLTLRADYYGGLDRLPDYQNVATTVDHLTSVRARAGYRDLRGSLGRVDDEKGNRWQVGLDGDLVAGDAFVRTWADLDLGFALPLGHSSIWVRNSAGFSPNDRAAPFANFYFGGFGNNWVDHGEEKRYRERDSFPGAEINAIGGRNYARSTIEWNLPPLRFRRLGHAGFYATWARTSLFTSGLVTDLDAGAARRALANVGAQVDVRFTVLSALDMTLSAGYAVAFEGGARRRPEAMVSLKLLR
jgi:WD40-like Beta Propeller Repeat